MFGTTQVVLLLLGLGLLFAPEIHKAANSYSTAGPGEIDVDQGRSIHGKVHVAYCTS
jgi:hypothetical protein